ncbi:MAG: EF-P lysine aminoacylase EpmA [Hyphomicrobiaceae bacterium]
MHDRRPSPWWAPERHEDRRPRLLLRAHLKQTIRAYFHSQDFIEVDTLALQASPGNETHLHAFATDLDMTTGERRRLYLHTSPEFACKKLLAAGERRIYTFAPVFRNGERGRLHHPEFTMLEWYRAQEPYGMVMEDCAHILTIAAEVAGCAAFVHQQTACPAQHPPVRLSVRDAIVRHHGIDILPTIASPLAPDAVALRALARAKGHAIADDETWSDVFSRLVAGLEGELGNDAPVLLVEYPAIEAALARPKAADPRLAERFELYVAGIELANGFGELTDGPAQRARLESQMAERERRYGTRYPIDDDFIAAVDRMPEASGCALGFDRLVMLATGAERIDDVIWTPLDEEP